MERSHSTSEGSPLPTSEDLPSPFPEGLPLRFPAHPLPGGACICLSPSDLPRGTTDEHTLLEVLRLHHDATSPVQSAASGIVRYDEQMLRRYLTGSGAYTGSPPGSLISDGSPFVSFIDCGDVCERLPGTLFGFGDPSRCRLASTADVDEMFDLPIPGGGSHIQTFSP